MGHKDLNVLTGWWYYRVYLNKKMADCAFDNKVVVRWGSTVFKK